MENVIVAKKKKVPAFLAPSGENFLIKGVNLKKFYFCGKIQVENNGCFALMLTNGRKVKICQKVGNIFKCVKTFTISQNKKNNLVLSIFSEEVR